MIGCLFGKKFIASKSRLISDCGQSVDDNFYHSGPSHHLDMLKLSILQPLGGRSAGFKEPEMCLHSAGLNFEFERYFGAEPRDQPLDKLLRTVSVVEILRTVFEFENLIYTKCGYRSSLKKIRTPVRRAATELSNSIKIEIEKENASSDLVEELLAKLFDKEKQLENVDKDITILTNMDDLEKEVEKQQEYRDSIITCKVRANKILNKRETESRNTPTTSSRSEQQFSSLKLPQLQIPQFDGNILKFSDFFAQFEAAIHNNSNLSDVEKFNYLKSYLIDEAEIAIRGLTLSANNYTIALNIIKEQFGRKDLIIDSHMSKLLHLNPVRKSDDILSLRKLYSECEIHIQGLQNCRVNPDTYSSLLYPIILKSIPRDLSLEFTRKSYGQTENMISDLLDFLKTEIQCREKNEYLTKEFNSYDSNPRKETKNYYNEKPNYKHKILEYGLGWDEQLPSELKNKWETWCSEVCLLNDLTLERKYFPYPLHKGKDLQLHIFCDASPRAFGAVAYFRYATANDDIYTSFIAAKSRVSPLKKLTLPRLELLGAVLASRILKCLRSKFKFPISKFYLRSDSSIALHWIKGKASNYKQFVSNRVIEIQSNSDPSDWHHCSGRENPAVYVSRGANLETIINSQFWMHGPQWLRTTENNWPKSLNCDFSSTDPCESEE
ncbi:uncharacterized protein TNCV_4928651 [Trichonephila clavipes]|nr:uncharacterized protein TNCV_4928651 [Trichonephila clavipes]